MIATRFSRASNTVIPDGVHIKNLTAIVTIIGLVCTFTIAAVMFGYLFMSRWHNNVSTEVTIQIIPAPNTDVEGKLLQAATIANNTDGVQKVKIINVDDTLELIKPWIEIAEDDSQTIDKQKISDLPIPRLIAVKLKSSGDNILNKLTNAITKAIPDAIIDSHSNWNEALAARAQMFIATGLFIVAFAIITMALTTIAITRSALVVNQSIIDTLELIGASNAFIIKELQMWAFRVGFKGALWGMLVAVPVFIIFVLWIEYFKIDNPASIFSKLDDLKSIFHPSYLLIALIAPGCGLIAAICSRLTTSRYLSKTSN